MFVCKPMAGSLILVVSVFNNWLDYYGEKGLNFDICKTLKMTLYSQINP